MCRDKARVMPGIFVSQKSKQSAFRKFRELNLHKWRKPITEIAKVLNPIIRGLSNYYQKFWDGVLSQVWHQLNIRLLKWVKWEKGLYGKGPNDGSVAYTNKSPDYLSIGDGYIHDAHIVYCDL